MIRRVFCCCLPYTPKGDEYKPLNAKGGGYDAPNAKGVQEGESHRKTHLSSNPPFQYTSPLVHVHITTTQGEMPVPCCHRAGDKDREKDTVEGAPNKVNKASNVLHQYDHVNPEGAPISNAPLRYYQGNDPEPLYTSHLAWTPYSEDMKTCIEEGVQSLG